ncbi:MAG: hypothetical protein ABW208_24600 [Pyrinomonadaceae bacterium]
MPDKSKHANPFPGLRPFEPGETHLFFGRDGQSREIIRRLEHTRFLAIVGTSGSGKSSLVRAGLLPALRGGEMADAGAGWRVAIVRPGDNPIGNLAAQLASPEVFGSNDPTEAAMQRAFTEASLRRSSLGLLDVVRQARGGGGAGSRPLLDFENVLILVDQFEELFRFRSLIEVENSKEDSAAFVSLLLEAARQREAPVYVVLTMRSDFLGDCAQFQGLPEAINDGQYLIPRMTRDERRSAVTGPVAVAHARITEPLVNQLLNDMGDNPDQLPILQHALMRTYDYWQTVRLDGEPIDLPHYKAIGGMSEALSQHAEEAYAELSESRQAIAEKLFKALTEKGADNRETRRPLAIGDACAVTEASEAEVVAVVETFRRPGRSFLMPPADRPLTHDSLLDISHESLIRNWARLKKWTEEEAQSARIYKRLAETAVLHRAGQEAPLKDPALPVALDWRERSRPNAAWARRYHTEFDTAMSFLDASVRERDAELLELKKRQRREVSYKRTRLAALFLALSFLLSLGATGYSYNLMAQARASKDVALQERALATEELKQARIERDQAKVETIVAEEKKGLAEDATAKALKDQKSAEEAKATAERQTEIALKREQQANVALGLAQKQSDYNALVAEKNAAETKQTQQLLYPTIINLAQQAYESNELGRGREMLTLQQTAIGDTPGFEWFYMNRLLHNEKESIEAKGIGLKFVGASSDGKTLVHVSGDEIHFRDIATGKTEVVSSAGGTDEEFSVGCIAISPDGKKLALGNSIAAEPSVKLYDIETRKGSGSLNAGTRSVNAVAFTADSKRVIAGSGIMTKGSAPPAPYIKIWDVDSLAPAGSIQTEAHDNNFAVSPDGKTIAVNKGFSVGVWDLTLNKEVEQVQGEAAITSLAFSAGGRLLAVGMLNKAVTVWDVPYGGKELWNYDSSPFSLAYSPDGKRLAVGFADGTINICDAVKRYPCAVLKGHAETVTSLAFSPDSGLLYSSDNRRTGMLEFSESEDTTVKTWDVAVALREQTPVPDIEKRGLVVLAYSPDSKTLVATGDNSQAMLLDAETNRLVTNLYETERSVTAVAFTPDGRTAATADDEEVTFWNVATATQEGAPLKIKNVNSLTFSQGGRLLVTASAFNGAVTAWDVATRKEVRAARGKGGEDNYVARLSLSHDGASLLFTRNNILEVWDAGLEKQQRRAGLHLSDEGIVTSLAHSRDGRLIAVGDSLKRVVLLDAKSLGVVTVIVLPNKDEVHALAFSPDSKTLATGGESGTVKLWSTASFQELLTLRGSGQGTVAGPAIRVVTFSHDGTKLATVDNESNLRVWYAPATAEAARTTPPVRER